MMITQDVLRTAMDNAGISSAAELARRSGLNEVTVRSYLNGSRDLTKVGPLRAIAGALGIPVETIVADHAAPPDSDRSSLDGEQNGNHKAGADFQ